MNLEEKGGKMKVEKAVLRQFGLSLFLVVCIAVVGGFSKNFAKDVKNKFINHKFIDKSGCFVKVSEISAVTLTNGKIIIHFRNSTDILFFTGEDIELFYDEIIKKIEISK